MARWKQQALVRAFNQWTAVTINAPQPEPEPEPEPVVLVVKQPRARSPVRLVVQDTRKSLGNGYWCTYGESYGIGIAAVPDGEEPNFTYTSSAGSPESRGSAQRYGSPNLMGASQFPGTAGHKSPSNTNSYAEQVQSNANGGVKLASPSEGSRFRRSGNANAAIQLVHCTQNTLTVKWPCSEPQAKAFPHTLLLSANGVEFKPVTVVNPADHEELQHTMTNLRPGTSYVIRVDVGGHLKYWSTLQTLAGKTSGSPRRAQNSPSRSAARSPQSASRSRFNREAPRFSR